MGCCVSTERQSQPSSPQQPEITASPATSSVGQSNNNNGSTNNIYSPSSSRAPLTAPEGDSTTSLPRQLTATRTHRSSRSRRSTTDPTLTSHYNLALLAPKSWKSSTKRWTPNSAAKERQDFFDTRVTGRKEVWEALRQVSECIRDNDLTTAQGILDAAGITLPTGRVEDGCYDERGELYKIPHIIVKDPQNLQAEGHVDEATIVGDDVEDKAIELTSQTDADQDMPLSGAVLTDAASSGKGKELINENMVQVRCRWSHTGLDTLLSVDKTQQGSLVFSQLKQQNKMAEEARLRLFYLGKELKEKDKGTMEDFGWREGHVLNVFLVGVTT